MKIIYTINGREASWCVSGRDKSELQRIMNDGIGIPPDPMLDVLVFTAYMGEYNTFYRFYRDFVEECLDPDELFDTEPIEYFNTVLSPLLDEDVEILDIIDCDMVENKKENKMNKLRRLREAFEDTSFDVADRFVAQARKVVNNIADNISEIYADEEMSPHHEAWLDEVADSFKILKAGASKLRDGSITPCQFLDYIERFMAVTEDEDATDDYLALWPIRKMFVSSYGLEDSNYACCEAARGKTKGRKGIAKVRESEDKKLSDYVKEAQERVALIAGKKKLNERFSSVEEERDARERFCILMDWEIKPEDVLHCVKDADDNFIMQLKDGTQFIYDPVNDCLR